MTPSCSTRWRGAGGEIFKTVGDAFCVAFAHPHDAVQAALATQRALAEAAWQETGPLRVRMALHCGVAELRDGDYFGPTLNRVSRVLSVGHGGQMLLTQAVADSVRAALPSHASLRDLGEQRLKGPAPAGARLPARQRRPARRLPAAALAGVPAQQPARAGHQLRRPRARDGRGEAAAAGHPARHPHGPRRPRARRACRNRSPPTCSTSSRTASGWWSSRPFPTPSSSRRRSPTPSACARPAINPRWPRWWTRCTRAGCWWCSTTASISSRPAPASPPRCCAAART
ncbi:MAG: adenylate/guanylate cyclase domain-containing protein [Verrucomicrobiota bacterium]